MIISRGVGALVVIVIICFYSILSIIINPINESLFVSTSDAYVPFGLRDANRFLNLLQDLTVVAGSPSGIMNESAIKIEGLFLSGESGRNNVRIKNNPFVRPMCTHRYQLYSTFINKQCGLPEWIRWNILSRKLAIR